MFTDIKTSRDTMAEFRSKMADSGRLEELGGIDLQVQVGAGSAPWLGAWTPGHWIRGLLWQQWVTSGSRCGAPECSCRRACGGGEQDCEGRRERAAPVDWDERLNTSSCSVEVRGSRHGFSASSSCWRLR